MSVTCFLGGLFLLNLLLQAPGWLGRGAPGAPWVAWEALVVGGLLLLVPRSRAGRLLPPVLVTGAVAAFVVGVAEEAAQQSLARPLNLYLDLRLASSVWSLLEGSVGVGRALFMAAGAVALLLAVATLLWMTLDGPLRPGPGDPDTGLLRRHLPRALAGVLLLGLLASAHATSGDAEEPGPAAGWTATPALDHLRTQREAWARMRTAQEDFAADMAASPATFRDLPGLLQGLGGSEVILAFVESYGVSALEDPRYHPIVGPRLDTLEARMAAAGLHLVSGRLEAPIQGGQSWLGRGSTLSGLWLDDHLRYELLLASPRETLVDDFRRAGYTTAAVMPAITLAWPEGERFGYDRIFAHRDMEYEGPPIHWVTKPDEYTWCFFQRRVRSLGTPERPLFTEVALISSHAPWVPILPVLGSCEAVGSGTVYEPYMEASARPEDLWREPDDVRQHFAMAVEYALHAAQLFAERDLGPHALLILLGDHQPAPLVTGRDASMSVPVHVISARRELVEPFLAWGFRPGAWPPPEGSHPEGGGADLRMDRFRPWFVEAFSAPAGPDRLR